MLGLNINKKDVYKRAFQHKSFCETKNNERLEFLGDSVLNTVVSEHVFLTHKNKEEGFLSKKRALIVGRRHLNKVGKKLIKEKDIRSNLKTIPKNIFGNTLEAIIGAIYIDLGMNKTKEFILNNIINSGFNEELSKTDNKTKLQTIIQKQKKQIQYKVVKATGPDHKKEFEVALFIDKTSIATGKAFSIKDAEQKAAEKALKIVF